MKPKATSERLAFFSDAVFAVIITIMVLESRSPERPTLDALLPLWPTFLSYLVSYWFIAIVWVNHHHLMQFAERVSPQLIWVNFVHLFFVSLVPFATAWVANTRFAAVPVAFYAAVFVLVDSAFTVFQRLVLAQANIEEISHKARRFATMRAMGTLVGFALAAVVSLKLPFVGFGLVCCTLAMYLRPD